MTHSSKQTAELQRAVDYLVQIPLKDLLGQIIEIEENILTLRDNGITIVRLKEYALLVQAKKALVEAVRRHNGQSVPKKTKKSSGNGLSRGQGSGKSAKKGMQRRLSLVYSRS